MKKKILLSMLLLGASMFFAQKTFAHPPHGGHHGPHGRPPMMHHAPHHRPIMPIRHHHIYHGGFYTSPFYYGTYYPTTGIFRHNHIYPYGFHSGFGATFHISI